MTERILKVIQWFGNKVPAMASCTKCQYKFVTPNSLKRDPEAAEKYLREKFDLHKCGGHGSKLVENWEIVEAEWRRNQRG
jgi:hypothetical protein